MVNPLYASPNFSTTLNVGGGINNSQTVGIVLTSVTNLNVNGGILGLDWASTIDTAVYEEIEYTGFTGNELTGVTRGVNGFTAKSHSNAAVIVNVVSSLHNNRLADKHTSRDATLVQDPNGNSILATTYVASAVNQITASNAATGNAPSIVATGTDANIDLELKGKGTGKFKATSAYGSITVDTDGVTITFDCSPTGGNRHQVILGGNRTLALSNASSGQAIILDLIQDGTGSRTVTWFVGPALTVTMTIAAPCVVTSLDIPTGTPVVFTTTGALPTGITAGTTYYWIRVSATTGNIATSLANAQAGTTVTTTGTQSGVHTMKTAIRWASQTAPTLSTGKYLGDLIGIYVKDATAGIYDGVVISQAM